MIATWRISRIIFLSFAAIVPILLFPAFLAAGFPPLLIHTFIFCTFDFLSEKKKGGFTALLGPIAIIALSNANVNRVLFFFSTFFKNQH